MIVGFKETEIGRKDKKKRCAGKGEVIQGCTTNRLACQAMVGGLNC
jgi:hypothetical protein